jgi:hypothetical protein
MITAITNLHESMSMIQTLLASKDPADPKKGDEKPSKESKDGKEKDKSKEKSGQKPDEFVVTRSELETLFRYQRKVDEALMDRLFIIQVAVEDGWTTAKDVAFFKAGEICFACTSGFILLKARHSFRDAQ